MKKSERLFLDILPDYLTSGEMPELFSKKRLKLLKHNNVRTAFIISSEPVDPEIYLSLVRVFNSAGIKNASYYFESGNVDHLESLRTAVSDLACALDRGGCLVISYRTRFALPLIAALHISRGSDIDEAISAVRGKKKNASDLHDFRGLLLRFHGSPMVSQEGSEGVRDAIRIDRSPLSGAKKPQSGLMLPSTGGSSQVQTATRIVDKGTKGKRRTDTSKVPDSSVTHELTEGVSAGKASRGPFYRSIRFKLISIISFIIIVSLAGMIYLASYFFKKDNRVRVQESNFQIAEVIALKMESEIDKYQLISTLIMNKGKGPSAGQESLVAAGDKDVIFIGIVTRAVKGGRFGFARSHFNRSLMDKYLISEKNIAAANVAYEASFPISFAGEFQIHNPSPHLEHDSIALIFPFEIERNGSVKSIIISYIRLDNLKKTFNMPGITRSFMTNFKGDVIVHPDGTLVRNGSNVASIPICSMMMKSKIDNGQTRFRDENNVDYLGSFKKIEKGGFAVIASAREDEAYRAVYKIQERNMIITGMVLIVAILIIFFFGKTITSPIIRLVGATKKIIDGQYSIDIRPSSRDEIGQLTSTFIEMGRGLEEREKIKSAFGKFVNKELAEAALKDELRLGGERKTVAILFSDIRAFTAISERLEPEEVVEFLNLYMTKMVECIEKTNGIVDKFIGDAIMAVWGTPISRGNDTENALNSALLMRSELLEFNLDRGGTKKPLIHIGCGINTGIVLAGQIGSENRMEYTIIGDAVNLASRIESLTKAFGVDILISEDSYRLVRDIFAFEKMKQIKVKGKIEPQQIYALLGRLDDPARPKTLNELRSLIGISGIPAYTDEALARIIDHGEEKYEIIEK